MKNLNRRIDALENSANPAAIMLDADRFAQIKQLAAKIATEASSQGVTAADDPRLLYPLAVFESIGGLAQ